MNTIFKTSLSLLLLIVNFNVNAARQFEVNVNSENVLEIQITGNDDNNKLSFIDAKGELLFVDTELSQPYFKKISLKTLPKGTYTISLENSNIISYKSVLKTSRGIKVEDYGVVFKPKFKVMNTNKRQVRVSFTNPTKDFTQMKIYDAEGHLIMDVKDKDLVFKKTLDFSEAPAGEYSVAINSRGLSYLEKLYIK
ncbi:T9SS type A sorting domain-containing protein [Psychroflexus lacisalsi]|jgi:hypothetical protein|uniref:Secretion system C-terminal sorting domain-containing protein n=1 Tax=Psychroflexus lacisalsi TaxID=503928 RepID=A0ABP3VLJ0_9FLAO|nr:T9SS type A sorting domain-containing protein [Psychroflexus lacisalsi]MBZ9620168.1 hypothetical protein [Psychroflexus lacisalsi]